MSTPFGDRFAEAVREKKSVVVVGIDPVLEKLPPEVIREGESEDFPLLSKLVNFGLGIIDAVEDLVPAVKPNIAFFEAFGTEGLIAYHSICAAAWEEGLLVIGDIKRGDIGSTAAAYAQGHLSTQHLDMPEDDDEDEEVFLGPHDALTLNPYLGTDSIMPFLEPAKKNGQGLFILVKTSNPSSAEIQDLELKSGGSVAEAVACLVHEWGEDSVGASGLSAVGAVVGATHPDELALYRELMPTAPFLIPGYGAQGGSAADVVGGFRADGSGALVNASRSILYAWQKENAPDDWQGAARRATIRMNEDLTRALQAAGKWDL